jgi:hypothetical protein
MNPNEQRRLEQLALSSLTEADCPDADQLAAYILGTLTGTAQLRVAAHVRSCPLCQDDIAACRPPAPRPRLVLAHLLPLSLADGRRSAPLYQHVRRYVAADLTVELTIPPPVGDYWRITGQVMRAEQGLAGRPVTLQASRRRYQQTSDAQGFFTFERVPTGRYTLSVTDELIQVQLRALVLSLDES